MAQGGDASDPDLPLKVAARLDAMRQTAANDTFKRLNLMSDLIHQHGSRVDFSRTETEIEAHLNEMKANAREAGGDIESLRERFIEQKAHFTAFRDRRSLKRPAAKPPSAFGTTWLLYIFWIVESLINMLLFAGGNALGFVGGFFISLLISSVNIVFSFLFGFVITKQVNSIFIGKKIGSWLLIFGYFILLIAAHFVVAHYRAQQLLGSEEELYLTNTEYFVHALQALQANFWLLPDFESYILLGLGVLFGLYAWWKGYHFGDRYPGYTKEFKDLEGHRREYEDRCTDLINELKSVRDDAVARIAAFIDSVGPSVQAMQSNAAAARSLVEHYRTFAKSCDLTEELVGRKFAGLTSPASSENAKSRSQDRAGIIEEMSRLVDAMLSETSSTVTYADGVKLAARNCRDRVLMEINLAEGEIKSKMGELNGSQ